MAGRFFKFVLIYLLSLSFSAYAQDLKSVKHITNNIDGSQTLLNHVPQEVVLGQAIKIAHADPQQMLNLKIMLPSKDPAGLKNFIAELYDPKSPNFHQFLTPAEFASMFGASSADSAIVTQYLTSLGLTVKSQSPDGFIIRATGPVSAVEPAFKVNINNYRALDGKTYYAPDSNPTISAQVAGKVYAIIGMDNMTRYHPGSYRKSILRLGDLKKPVKIRNLSETMAPASGRKLNVGNANNITPLVGPPTPTGLNAHVGNSYEAELFWTASTGATSYNIYRATSSGGEGSIAYDSVSTAPLTTYTDIDGGSGGNGGAGLTDGTTYYYEVTSVDAGGESAKSNEVSVTPYALLGSGGSMGPTDITTLYNFNSLANTGGGQTLALFEEDGYTAGDITTFESNYSISPEVSLTNIIDTTDGADGSAGANADYVELDIDLAIAAAPGLSSIRVYETVNTSAGWIEQWDQIATDDIAKVVSCQWGFYEAGSYDSFDDTVFSELAGEGVTIFAAAGDAGAYDNCDPDSLPGNCNIQGNPGTGILSVQDPASDEYVTGVGTTFITVTDPGVNGQEAYGSETASLFGGGGVSSDVSVPSWQVTAATNAYNAYNGLIGSKTQRNVPDVSLAADPLTVYGVYLSDQNPATWYGLTGSAAASVIWAGFMTRVNQGRVASGQTTIGWLNPVIYLIAQGSSYKNDFHDISSQFSISYPSNSYYAAETGYDNATGLGSLNGANVYSDLLGPPPPTNLNASAENAQVDLTWTASTGTVAYYNVERSTISGGPYTTITTSDQVPGTSYNDSTVANGTTYYYVVSSVNSSLVGADSSEVSATPELVPVAPNITTQPTNQTVTAPAIATFSLTATGTPSPTYQWQQSTNSGSTWTSINGATTATYTTASTSASNNGTEFNCVVSNSAGTATSNAATLTVHTTPSVTTQPTNQTVTAPATATFSLIATGSPAPTYQWQQSTNSGSTWTTIGGATSASYTTGATSLANSGTEYECVLTNSVGTSTSNAVTLTVNAAPGFTTQPASQTVTAPATASFTVVATGTPAPTYQWQQSTNSGSTWTTIGGATSASYTTGATSLANSGTEYECVLTNTAGTSTSNAVTLTVYTTPSVSTQPTSQTVTAPATATFTVVAAGTPAPTYQWEQSTNSGSTWTTIGGATSASYTTGATSLANSGTEYKCVLTNSAGTANSNAVTLTVNAAPGFTTQPASQTVTAPATASFTVVATGTPAPTYQWQQSTNSGSTWTTIGGATSASYTTGATSLANSGTEYECVLTNTAGTSTSNAVTLTVYTTPSVSTQPTSQTVTAPATATFTVVAAGTPAPTYQWEQSTNSGSTWTTIGGATSASYTTGATSLANSGTEYKCVLTNSAGTANSNAVTLTVYTTPSVSTQPTSQTVTAPATATFSLVAAGTPAPTYQWEQSTNSGSTWTTIGGATSASYTTGATSLANSGTEYKCVLTNSAGTANSNAVTLTVYTTPSVSTQPTSQTVTAPATATFTVVAAGTPAPTYQWEQSTNSGSTWTTIGGATSASYTTGATSSANNGTEFECVLTNSAGTATSNAAILTVDFAPSISLQPASQTVVAPSTASFTVTASGNPAPSYQWQQSTNSGSTWTSINGATSSSYTTGATSVQISGTEYECVVTNSINTVTSNAATLTVSPTPASPNITTQPISQTVTSPATATFSLVATGIPTPSYQWDQSTNGGSAWTSINGATSASYTTPATSLQNSGTEYKCVLSNTSGTVTSNVVTLTVDTTPSVTTQPASQTVTAPATATFSLIAAGSPAPTYQWQESTNSGSTWTTINGATGASYSTGSTSLANSGTEYECVISNLAGTATSNAVTLTVYTTPSVSTQPTSQTVTAPSTATFTLIAAGTPAPSYQWQQSTNSGSTWTTINGATSASYTTSGTSFSNNGTEYECVLTNSAGTVTSNAVTLTVDYAPSITAQPVNQTVTQPATASFTVAANGNPSPGYQWQESTNSGSTWTSIAGATGASYTTPATSLSNSGTEYECVITNTVSSVTSNAVTLTVNALPSISTQPTSQTVTEPATATFSLVAGGTPSPTYQWEQSTNEGSTWTSINGATSASYTTPATSLTNNGTEYKCVLTNSAGTLTSNAVTLTVDSIPSFTIQPSDQTVVAPAAATFTIAAIGTPAPTYQWQESTDSGSTWSSINGATNSSYSTGSTTLQESGTEYECVITNTAGSATSTAVTLTVNTIPSISTQPVSQTVTEPGTATFTVIAAGTPSPSYQWEQSTNSGSTWNPIGGATSSSYTTGGTSSLNDGTQFKCVVTNSAETITSNAVTLTVDYAPVISTQPGNQTVVVTESAVFSLAASSEPSPSYQWQESTNSGSTWTSIGGATSASYTTPATILSNSGTEYQCIVTNSIGTTTSNPVTLTVTLGPLAGVCGAASTTYAYGTTGFGSDALCSTGTPSPSQVSFPAPGQSVAWTCQGYNGGKNVSCNAVQNAKVIIRF